MSIATIVILLAGAYLFGLQTLAYSEFSHLSRRFPVINFTPGELKSASVNMDPGLEISHAGFTFEVPWTDLNREKSKVVGNWDILAFDSGLVVTFCPPSANHEDLMNEVQKHLGNSRENLVKVFGKDAVQSNYAFHAALLNSTSTDLRPWSNEKSAFRSSTILMFKSISTVGGNTGLFRADRNEWKGFQMDDPRQSPPSVALELYSPADEHVEIMFQVRREGKFHPTQADINRVLGTLHRTTDLDTKVIATSQSVLTR
jgi:hypothetical protein